MKALFTRASRWRRSASSTTNSADSPTIRNTQSPIPDRSPSAPAIPQELPAFDFETDKNTPKMSEKKPNSPPNPLKRVEATTAPAAATNPEVTKHIEPIHEHVEPETEIDLKSRILAANSHTAEPIPKMASLSLGPPTVSVASLNDLTFSSASSRMLEAEPASSGDKLFGTDGEAKGSPVVEEDIVSPPSPDSVSVHTVAHSKASCTMLDHEPAGPEDGFPKACHVNTGEDSNPISPESSALSVRTSAPSEASSTTLDFEPVDSGEVLREDGRKSGRPTPEEQGKIMPEPLSALTTSNAEVPTVTSANTVDVGVQCQTDAQLGHLDEQAAANALIHLARDSSSGLSTSQRVELERWKGRHRRLNRTLDAMQQLEIRRENLRAILESIDKESGQHWRLPTGIEEERQHPGPHHTVAAESRLASAWHDKARSEMVELQRMLLSSELQCQEAPVAWEQVEIQEARAQKAEAKCKGLKGIADNLTNANKKLQKEMETEIARVQRMGAERNEALAEVARWKNNCEELERMRRLAEDQVSKVPGLFETVEEDEDREENITRLQRKYDDLEDMVLKYSDQDLLAYLIKTTAERDKAVTDLNLQMQKIALLEEGVEKLPDLREKVHTLEARNNGLRATNKVIHKEMNGLRNRIQVLQKEKGKETARAQKAESDHMKANRAVKELGAQHADLIDRNNLEKKRNAELSGLLQNNACLEMKVRGLETSSQQMSLEGGDTMSADKTLLNTLQETGKGSSPAKKEELPSYDELLRIQMLMTQEARSECDKVLADLRTSTERYETLKKVADGFKDKIKGNELEKACLQEGADDLRNTIKIDVKAKALHEELDGLRFILESWSVYADGILHGQFVSGFKDPWTKASPQDFRYLYAIAKIAIDDWVGTAWTLYQELSEAKRQIKVLADDKEKVVPDRRRQLEQTQEVLDTDVPQDVAKMSREDLEWFYQAAITFGKAELALRLDAEESQTKSEVKAAPTKAELVLQIQDLAELQSKRHIKQLERSSSELKAQHIQAQIESRIKNLEIDERISGISVDDRRLNTYDKKLERLEASQSDKSRGPKTSPTKLGHDSDDGPTSIVTEEPESQVSTLGSSLPTTSDDENDSDAILQESFVRVNVLCQEASVECAHTTSSVSKKLRGVIPNLRGGHGEPQTPIDTSVSSKRKRSTDSDTNTATPERERAEGRRGIGLQNSDPPPRYQASVEGPGEVEEAKFDPKPGDEAVHSSSEEECIIDVFKARVADLTTKLKNPNLTHEQRKEMDIRLLSSKEAIDRAKRAQDPYYKPYQVDDNYCAAKILADQYKNMLLYHVGGVSQAAVAYCRNTVRDRVKGQGDFPNDEEREVFIDMLVNEEFLDIAFNHGWPDQWQQATAIFRDFMAKSPNENNPRQFRPAGSRPLTAGGMNIFLPDENPAAEDPPAPDLVVKYDEERKENQAKTAAELAAEIMGEEEVKKPPKKKSKGKSKKRKRATIISVEEIDPSTESTIVQNIDGETKKTSREKIDQPSPDPIPTAASKEEKEKPKDKTPVLKPVPDSALLPTSQAVKPSGRKLQEKIIFAEDKVEAAKRKNDKTSQEFWEDQHETLLNKLDRTSSPDYESDVGSDDATEWMAVIHAKPVVQEKPKSKQQGPKWPKHTKKGPVPTKRETEPKQIGCKKTESAISVSVGASVVSAMERPKEVKRMEPTKPIPASAPVRPEMEGLKESKQKEATKPSPESTPAKVGREVLKEPKQTEPAKPLPVWGPTNLELTLAKDSKQTQPAMLPSYSAAKKRGLENLKDSKQTGPAKPLPAPAPANRERVGSKTAVQTQPVSNAADSKSQFTNSSQEKASKSFNRRHTRLVKGKYDNDRPSSSHQSKKPDQTPKVTTLPSEPELSCPEPVQAQTVSASADVGLPASEESIRVQSPSKPSEVQVIPSAQGLDQTQYAPNPTRLVLEPVYEADMDAYDASSPVLPSPPLHRRRALSDPSTAALTFTASNLMELDFSEDEDKDVVTKFEANAWRKEATKPKYQIPPVPAEAASKQSREVAQDIQSVSVPAEPKLMLSLPPRQDQQFRSTPAVSTPGKASNATKNRRQFQPHVVPARRSSFSHQRVYGPARPAQPNQVASVPEFTGDPSAPLGVHHLGVFHGWAQNLLAPTPVHPNINFLAELEHQHRVIASRVIELEEYQRLLASQEAQAPPYSAIPVPTSQIPEIIPPAQPIPVRYEPPPLITNWLSKSPSRLWFYRPSTFNQPRFSEERSLLAPPPTPSTDCWKEAEPCIVFSPAFTLLGAPY